MKYYIGQEGYIYGVVGGPFKVKISKKVFGRYNLEYIDGPNNTNGSLLSESEMKQHFIPVKDFNPIIHI